jgi:GNAT superfamily N-acetyltransferase
LTVEHANRQRPDEYRLEERFPPVADYLRLRLACGLSAKTERAAERGLHGTLFGVSVKHGEQVVGMGRVIGDGGCFFEVVDIAVLPEHQRRGLGRRIMSALSAWLRSNAPESALVSLIADGKAALLYAEFGFRECGAASCAMVLKM